MKLVRANHVYLYHRHMVSGKLVPTCYISDINIPIPDGVNVGDDNFPKCPDCSKLFKPSDVKKNNDIKCECGSILSIENDDYLREEYSNYSGD